MDRSNYEFDALADPTIGKRPYNEPWSLLTFPNSNAIKFPTDIQFVFESQKM